MSEMIYNKNGYPEPVMIYLGNSDILAFVMFSNIQEHHPLIPSGDYDPNQTFFDPTAPLFWDIEIKTPFKEKADGTTLKWEESKIDDWMFARNVTLEYGKQMCSKYLEDWCRRHGLALI